MSDPLAEALHNAYHDSKESGTTTVAELAAGMAAALRASPSRLAIAASLLTEEDAEEVAARLWVLLDHDCTVDGPDVLAALRGESR